MEKILVAMDPVRTNFYACIHALNLAKRIKAKVLFLLVFSLTAEKTEKSLEEELRDIEKRFSRVKHVPPLMYLKKRIMQRKAASRKAS